MNSLKSKDEKCLKLTSFVELRIFAYFPGGVMHWLVCIPWSQFQCSLVFKSLRFYPVDNKPIEQISVCQQVTLWENIILNCIVEIRNTAYSWWKVGNCIIPWNICITSTSSFPPQSPDACTPPGPRPPTSTCAGIWFRFLQARAGGSSMMNFYLKKLNPRFIIKPADISSSTTSNLVPSTIQDPCSRFNSMKPHNEGKVVARK